MFILPDMSDSHTVTAKVPRLGTIGKNHIQSSLSFV